jgi:hypothetical protein
MRSKAAGSAGAHFQPHILQPYLAESIPMLHIDYPKYTPCIFIDNELPFFSSLLPRHYGTRSGTFFITETLSYATLSHSKTRQSCAIQESTTVAERCGRSYFQLSRS